jgi:hypothetical protein
MMAKVRRLAISAASGSMTARCLAGRPGERNGGGRNPLTKM